VTDNFDRAEMACDRAGELEDANDLEGAILAMSEAIALAPNELVYWLLRGRLYNLQEKWWAAIRDFDKVLAAKPNNPNARYSRGLARYGLDDMDGALEDFQQCIAREPDAADAWTQVGHIYQYRREWEAAIRAYERAAELDPDRRTRLGLLITEAQEQLWLREHGQLQPEPPQTRRYSPPPSQDPEAVQKRDELHEIFQRRREAAVPYQRTREGRKDSDG
jgi:tetratricopeptide (TPR) repeat protein